MSARRRKRPYSFQEYTDKALIQHVFLASVFSTPGLILGVHFHERMAWRT